MSEQNPHKLTIAILVRVFPNIVQTYVLNHILSMKNTGMKPLIVAESRSNKREVHPAIYEHNLLDDTIYINVERQDLLEQLRQLPLGNGKYLSAVLRVIFSGIWFRHGLKYTLKSMIRARALAYGKLDIIHSHSLFCSYDYLFLREVFSIPFTTTFHGLVPNSVKMLERSKITEVLQAGDAFFVNTRFARKQLTDFGCPEDKIHIIPQSTNTSDFQFRERSIEPDQPIVIVSVGRLSIEKGFHIAIRAVARLKERFPNIEYRIVGSGLEEQNLKDLIRSLGVDDFVHLCGSVTTEELLDHYKQANMFILPSIDLREGSHTETQGVVLQEAQSSGIPVIASRTGGIPEVIKDGETGLLFDEEDDEALARHIERLITDRDLYHIISVQARKDVEDNYSIKVIQKRLSDVYQSIINRMSRGT